MNVKKLDETRKARVHETVHIYKNLINNLWGKIQRIDNNNMGTSYIYQVPNFILGEPQYDSKIASEIIQRKLKKGGFFISTTQYNNSFLIYISWDKNEIDTHRKATKKKQNQPNDLHDEKQGYSRLSQEKKQTERSRKPYHIDHYRGHY